ncbi:MAG: glycosyltransferase family 2 protein [Oligoflexia bacterium]|nr:glycosyltransferase family 2 protein [Oligoflexia bacterium]
MQEPKLRQHSPPPLDIDIIIPVYNEGDNIYSCLNRIKNEVNLRYNIFLVYDFPSDDTLPMAERAAQDLNLNITLLQNNSGNGKGALNAIKTGIQAAVSPYIVITMADLSDPPVVINDMHKKAIEGKYNLVCGSRYMPGGKQIGGPFLKRTLSRCAGISLRRIIAFPTHDVTNSFKLYDRRLFDHITLESCGGFEIGMEIVVKAYAQGFKIGEVPTSWWDRSNGASRFQLVRWLPRYLKWYFWAINQAIDHAIDRIGIVYLVYLPCIFFALKQLYYICQCAVDVPFADEWEALNRGALGLELNWQWIFSPHNEHRIIFTKLITYLSYLLDRWNIRHQIIFNYFIFLGVIFLLFKFKNLIFANFRQKEPKEGECPPQNSQIHRKTSNFLLTPFYFFPLFVYFLFSPLNFQNHLWGFQNQFHLVLLFSLLATIVGFTKFPLSWNRTILFSLLIVATMFSFSSGVVMSTILTTFFVLKEILLHHSWQKNSSTNYNYNYNDSYSYKIKNTYLMRIPTVILILILSLQFWSSGTHIAHTAEVANSSSLTWPTQKIFWQYFLSLQAHAFSISKDPSIYWYLGIVPFALWGIAVILFLTKIISSKKEPISNNIAENYAWGWIAFASSIVGALATIALGRAHYGVLHAYTPRYIEISFFLIPTLAAAYWILLSAYPFTRKILLTSFFLITSVAYNNHFNFSDYRQVRAERLEMLKCLKEYYLKRNTLPANWGNTESVCPLAYPFPMNEKLAVAKELGVNFTL